MNAIIQTKLMILKNVHDLQALIVIAVVVCVLYMLLRKERFQLEL